MMSSYIDIYSDIHPQRAGAGSWRRPSTSLGPLAPRKKTGRPRLQVDESIYPSASYMCESRAV